MDARFHLYKIIMLHLMMGSFFIACSSNKPTPTSAEQDAVPNDSQRLENLSQTVSRIQSRMEELDAKLNAMNDKLASSKPHEELQVKTQDLTIVSKDIKTTPIPVKKQNKISKKIVAEKTIHTSSIDEATGAFMKGMKLFKEAKYSEVIIEFNKFSESYPDNILAGSSQYYIAESYFLLGEFTLAKAEFEKVITMFPSSPRVVNAQIRLSQCYNNIGKNHDAGEIYANAEKLYIGNPSFELTNVSQKIQNSKTETSAVSKNTTTEIKKPADHSNDTIVEETLPLEPMGLEQPAKSHE